MFVRKHIFSYPCVVCIYIRGPEGNATLRNEQKRGSFFGLAQKRNETAGLYEVLVKQSESQKINPKIGREEDRGGT